MLHCNIHIFMATVSQELCFSLLDKCFLSSKNVNTPSSSRKGGEPIHPFQPIHYTSINWLYIKSWLLLYPLANPFPFSKSIKVIIHTLMSGCSSHTGITIHTQKVTTWQHERGGGRSRWTKEECNCMFDTASMPWREWYRQQRLQCEDEFEWHRFFLKFRMTVSSEY